MIRIRSQSKTILWVAIYITLLLGCFYWLYRSVGFGFDYEVYRKSIVAAAAGGKPYLVDGEPVFYYPAAFLILYPLSLFPYGIGLLLWLLTVGVSWAVATYLSIKIAARDNPRFSTVQQRFITIALLCFAPLWETLHLGQLNTIVTLLMVAVLYYSSRQQQELAGTCLAVASILKLSPVVLLLYFLAVRQYRAILSTGITVAILTLLTWLAFGNTVFIDFMATLPANAAAMPAWGGRSIGPTAIIERIVTVFGGHSVTGLNIVYQVLIGITILAAFLYVIQRHDHWEVQHWFYAVLMFALTILSPRVWYHHNTFLLVPIVLVFASQSSRLKLLMLSALTLIQAERLIYYMSASYAPTLLPDNPAIAIALSAGTSTLVGWILLAIGLYQYRKLLVLKHAEEYR